MNAVEQIANPAARIIVPPSEEVSARLQNELPIVATVPEGVPHINLNLVGYPWGSDGKIIWSHRYGPPEPGLRELDPDSAEMLAFFPEVEAGLRTHDNLFKLLPHYDGRWWDGTGPIIEKEVRSLQEVYRLTITDAAGEERSIDIFNCHPGTTLTEEEVAELRYTFELLGEYTQGKIYDRIKGIIFSSDERFEDQSLGSFMSYPKVMLLNLDEIRSASNIMPPRYSRFFAGREDITALGATVGHEGGHAMDIATVDEADSHFIDKGDEERVGQAVWARVGNQTGDITALQNFPAWENVITGEGDKRKNNWRLNDAVLAEIGELPPTTYATTQPREQTGEVFCIDALKGDVSDMPMQTKLVREMVAKAGGRTMGPQTTTIEKLELPDGVYDPRRLQALRIHLFLPQ